MGLLQAIGFGGGGVTAQGNTEIENIFPMPIAAAAFVKADLQSIYARILTDVFERTQGLDEKQTALLSDNCLASESVEGLITMLARAMSEKSELYAIYDPGTEVIRLANATEKSAIKAAFTSGKDIPKNTIFVSFAKYHRTDMLKLYSELEYSTLAGLHKKSNLSASIQIKVDQLRASVSSVDSESVIAQGKAISTGLKLGKDVLTDKSDEIVCASPDLAATTTAIDFINQKRSFYLALPASWITGLSKSSMGDTGEGNARDVERGLKSYFFAIVKPICDALFGKPVTFKSEDFRSLTTVLEALKTFELIGNEYVSAENKLELINKMLGFPKGTKGDPAPTRPLAPAGNTGGQNVNAR